MQGIERNLRRESFALLVRDGESVDNVTDLGVIAHGVKESVGVGRHGSGAVSDGLIQSAARVETRELQERVSIDVLVSGGISLHLRAFRLYYDCGGFGGHFERDIHCGRQGAVHVHVLGDRSKTGRGYGHPIVVQRDAVEAIGAVRIGSGGLVKSSYSVAEANGGAGDYSAGWVRNRSADGAAVDGLCESGQG